MTIPAVLSAFLRPMRAFDRCGVFGLRGLLRDRPLRGFEHDRRSRSLRGVLQLFAAWIFTVSIFTVSIFTASIFTALIFVCAISMPAHAEARGARPAASAVSLRTRAGSTVGHRVTVRAVFPRSLHPTDIAWRLNRHGVAAARGKRSMSFVPKSAGTYRVTVDLRLSNRRYVRGSSDVTVTGGTTATPTPTPTIPGTPTPDIGDTLAQLYVAPTGNDSSGNGSQASPFKTIPHAITVAAGNTSGTRINVADGTYAPFHIDGYHGSASKQLVIKAQGSGAVISHATGDRGNIYLHDCSYVTIDGFTSNDGAGSLAAGFAVRYGSHVTIRNCTAASNNMWGIFASFVDDLTLENNHTYGTKVQHGIYVSNSSDRPVLRGNRSHDNAAIGIHMNGDVYTDDGEGIYVGTFDGIISGALIENNVLYNNGSTGLNMDGVTDSLIRNNVSYDNASKGISLNQVDGGSPPKNDLIYNNTVIGHSYSDLRVADSGGGLIARNNILGSNHGVDAPLDADYNIYLSTPDSMDEPHSFTSTATALFVGGDSLYHLKAGSPAIDKGTSLAQVPVDRDGLARPRGAAFDIGAYEVSE